MDKSFDPSTPLRAGFAQDRPWLKYYEPGVRAHIDYPALPMHAFLEDVATQSPDVTATIFGGVVQR